MAHQSIKQLNGEKYYEGDSLTIRCVFEEPNGTRIDLTDATVECRVKDHIAARDIDALLTLTNEGTNDGTAVTDALKGRADVYIRRDDTTGFLDDPDADRLKSDLFWVHVRAIDADNNQYTAIQAEWEIHAA